MMAAWRGTGPNHQIACGVSEYCSLRCVGTPHVILVNNELLRLEKLLHEQSRSSSAQGLNPRSAYSLLLALFVVSRTGYYLLGVRFHARPILKFFQFIDPELLKHRLLESMYYLHVQPPGFNLYTGIVLKLFPNAYPTAFHVIHLALGIGICWFTYYLMTA